MPFSTTNSSKDSTNNNPKETESGKEGIKGTLHYSTKNSHITVLYPPTNTTEPVSGQPQVVAKRKVKSASMWWPNACTTTSTPTSIGSFTYTSPEILSRFGFVDGDRSPIPAKYELCTPPAPTLGGHIHTIIPSTVTKNGSNLLKTLKYLTNSVEAKKGKNEGKAFTSTPAPTTTTTGSTFLDNIPAHSMLRETVLSAFDGSRLILDWRFADSSRRQHQSKDSNNNNERQEEEDAIPAIRVVVGAPGVMEGDLNHSQSPTYLDDFAPPSSWSEQLGVVAITFPSKKKNVEETATPSSPLATPLQPPPRHHRIPIKRGIFVILPGLTSSIESGYIQSLVLHASSPFHGFDVVVANARGLGQVDTFLDAPNMFCAAFTDDTKHLLLNEVSHEGLSRRGMYFAPDNNKPIPVVVAGFSFGGIILSRALGEIGQRIPVKVAKQISPLITNHKHHFTTNVNGNDSQPSTNEDLVNAALHAHGSRTHRTLGASETMNIVAAGTVCSPLDMEATNHFYTSKRINYLLYRSPLVEGLLDYIRRHSHILVTSEHASLRQVATLEIEKEIQLEKKKKPASASTKSITYFESYLRIKRKQALAAITADQRKHTQIEATFRVTPQSVWELEKCVIAPVFGFEDHFDYYRKSTPIVPGHLDGTALIRTPFPSTQSPSSSVEGSSSGTTATNNNGLIPIFCLCAEDDPIVGPGLTQRQQEELCERWWSHNQRSAPRNDDCGGGGIVVYNCSNGGHLGFLKGIFEEHKDSARLSQICSKQAALDKNRNDSPPSDVSRVVITQADIDWAHNLVYNSDCHADSWCPNFMEEFVVTAMRNALVTH